MLNLSIFAKFGQILHVNQSGPVYMNPIEKLIVKFDKNKKPFWYHSDIRKSLDLDM